MKATTALGKRSEPHGACRRRGSSHFTLSYGPTAVHVLQGTTVTHAKRLIVLCPLVLTACASGGVRTTIPTRADSSEVCASLGTTTSHVGIDVALVGVELSTPFAAEEEDELSFSMLPEMTFAFRLHAREAMVVVDAPRAFGVRTDDGRLLEDDGSFSTLPVEYSDSLRDALLYAGIGALAEAGTTCLVIEGEIPVRLADGVDVRRGRIDPRVGAVFVIEGATFRVTDIAHDPDDDFAMSIAFTTTDDVSRVRAFSFTQDGAPVEMGSTGFEQWRDEDDNQTTMIEYTLDADLEPIDFEASVYTALRDVSVPFRFGVTMGFGAPHTH